MADTKWIIGGERFQTKQEYDAALRDHKKIAQIRGKINFKDESQVKQLYGLLQSGKIKFESKLGRKFDDEIYELCYKGKKEGRVRDKSEGEDPSLEEDDMLKQQVILLAAKRAKRRKWITICCSITAVVCLGYFIVYSFFYQRTTSDYNQLAFLKDKPSVSIVGSGYVNKKGEEIPEILEEYKNLYIKNKSLIGWVKIADTNIDYPVMQTVNNEYYLNKNFNQEYDKNGSIFMDSNCDVLKPSTNLIVYGHHMRSGKMFGGLQKYSSEKYYKEHPIIEFDTIYEKGTYEIMYVFRSKIYTEDTITFKYYQFFDANSESEFNHYMEEMDQISFYDTGVKAAYGDELLTLSTCDNSEEEGRFVVVAKRVR